MVWDKNRHAPHWLLATGGWQLAAGNWLLAAGDWLLAAGNWLTARASMIVVFQNISIYFLLALAVGSWLPADCTKFEDKRISQDIIIKVKNHSDTNCQSPVANC